MARKIIALSLCLVLILITICGCSKKEDAFNKISPWTAKKSTNKKIEKIVKKDRISSFANFQLVKDCACIRIEVDYYDNQKFWYTQKMGVYKIDPPQDGTVGFYIKNKKITAIIDRKDGKTSKVVKDLKEFTAEDEKTMVVKGIEQQGKIKLDERMAIATITPQAIVSSMDDITGDPEDVLLSGKSWIVYATFQECEPEPTGE